MVLSCMEMLGQFWSQPTLGCLHQTRLSPDVAKLFPALQLVDASFVTLALCFALFPAACL